MPPKIDRTLYFRLVSAFTRFTRLYNRLEIAGAENIPKTGGALLCPRHENYSDPLFLLSAVQGRVLHFLISQGVEEMPLVGELIRRLGNYSSVPIQFGATTDKDHAKVALAQLAKTMEGGHLAVIFPEGSINHWILPRSIGPRGLKPFKTGAVRAAAQAGVPIIPVATMGTRWVLPNILNLDSFGGPKMDVFVPILLPHKVRMLFGAPFAVDPLAALDKETARSETRRLEEVTADTLYKLRSEPTFISMQPDL